MAARQWWCATRVTTCGFLPARPLCRTPTTPPCSIGPPPWVTTRPRSAECPSAGPSLAPAAIVLPEHAHEVSRRLVRLGDARRRLAVQHRRVRADQWRNLGSLSHPDRGR